MGDSMTTSTPPVRPQGNRSTFSIGTLAVVVAVAAFALGEWAEPRPARLAQREMSSEPPAHERVLAAVAPPVTAWSPEPARALPIPAAAAPAPVARATPDTVARVAGEARARIEALRGYIDASCWTGRAEERKTAKLTFNLTFDAQGREIARGISEDRMAPAQAFGSCLRKLQGTTLAIAPPGANVGVSIPVMFP
jgi:hypothetical protein